MGKEVMEESNIIFVLVAFVISFVILVLNAILFFKIWGMTNNIAELTVSIKNIQKNVFDMCVIAENSVADTPSPPDEEDATLIDVV